MTSSSGNVRGSEWLRVWLAAIALTIATGSVYWQTLDFDFVNADDHTYIVENYRVQQGLTRENLAWAFTSMSISNWHPLTWLSHMLDIEFYGLDPRGHHLSNLLLHLANTLLLFGLLQSLTGALWRSACVAALFALHPLHVESVAWVSERKDALCAFFWFLAMWSYARQVMRAERSAPKLSLPLVFTACALLSKPMAVTLPFTLLLLDYWPLNRLGWASLGHRVVEKLSFFTLSLLASLLTLSAQQAGGAMESGADVSLALRLSNAVVAYVAYLAKFLWPLDLAILYPHPYIAGTGGTPWETWQIAGSTGLLVLVSGLAVATRRAYFTAGWFWYLGTLVPVIGIVQVGTQAFADRYTYIPMIGVFVMLSWGVVDLAARWAPRQAASGWIGPVLLLVGYLLLGRLSWLQASNWRGSIPLFEHTLAVTGDNSIIHLALAASLLEAERLGEARVHANRALELKPDFGEALGTIASIDKQVGRHQQALRGLRHAISLSPTSANLHFNLANQLLILEDIDAAVRHYQRASELDPDWPSPHYRLGQVESLLGRAEEAVSHYQTALELHPGFHEARIAMADALADLERWDEAILTYQSILARDPSHAKALYGLARSRHGADLGSQ